MEPNPTAILPSIRSQKDNLRKPVVWERTKFPGIYKREWKDKAGNLKVSWKGHVNHGKGQQVAKTFSSLPLAKAWKAGLETKHERNTAGLPLQTPREQRKTTLSQAIDVYRDKHFQGEKSLWRYNIDYLNLTTFQRYDICNNSLYDCTVKEVRQLEKALREQKAHHGGNNTSRRIKRP